jgi:hypothetical protein
MIYWCHAYILFAQIIYYKITLGETVSRVIAYLSPSIMASLPQSLLSQTLPSAHPTHGGSSFGRDGMMETPHTVHMYGSQKHLHHAHARPEGQISAGKRPQSAPPVHHPYPPSASFVQPDPYPSAHRTVVDLRMAHTYIPALLCISQGVALSIGLVVCHHLLMDPRTIRWGCLCLVALGLGLYVHRIMYRNSLFDCSALLCTMYVAHAVHSVKPWLGMMIRAATLDCGSGTDPHAVNISTAVPTTMSFWYTICSILLCTTCICRVLLFDSLQASEQAPCGKPSRHTCTGYSAVYPWYKSGASESAILAVQFLLLTYIAVADIPAEFMHPLHIMARESLFLACCIVWTYVIGIRATVQVLSSHHIPPSVLTPPLMHDMYIGDTSSSPPSCSHKGTKRAVQSAIVQSFVPCQLRFVYILLLDIHYITCTSLLLLAVLFYHALYLTLQETHPEYTCNQQNVGNTGALPYSSDVLQGVPKVWIHTHPGDFAPRAVENIYTDTSAEVPLQTYEPDYLESGLGYLPKVKPENTLPPPPPTLSQSSPVYIAGVEASGRTQVMADNKGDDGENDVDDMQLFEHAIRQSHAAAGGGLQDHPVT